jgi:hypothetical protein
VVGIPVGVAGEILVNYGLHSVLRVFMRINCARILVSDLLLVLEAY